ncbi:MAG TPA: hypothetical protein VJ696_07310 [Rhodanobacteraceae bacterium]|nr:hypothetical protein [Rhodanobacteraceae bacterium]
MKRLHPVLAAFLALPLAACVETRFESPIGDNIETCDAGWKGLWTGTDRAADDAAAFYVDDECRFLVIDQPEKGGALKRIHVPVNYVHVGGKDYLVVADTAVKGLVELKPPHGISPTPEKSYFFARYRLRGDRIDLYQVDSEAAAKLVIEGKVDGTVDKTASELHVYVRGTRAGMLELVRNEDLFDDKRPLQLERSRQTLDDFERSLRKGAP